MSEEALTAFYEALGARNWQKTLETGFAALARDLAPESRAYVLVQMFNASKMGNLDHRTHEILGLMTACAQILDSRSVLLWEMNELLDFHHQRPQGFPAYTGCADPQPPGCPPWEFANPETLGLDPNRIKQLTDHCVETGADGCLLLHDGVIVSEWYSPVSRNPMSAMSSTKSIASLLFGILLDRGLIGSVHDPVGKYLPQWSRGPRADVSLYHILTMTAGFERIFDHRSVGYAHDKSSHVTDLIPDHPAGTKWLYSNESCQLLAPIMEKALGEPVQDFAAKNLFHPLGLRETFIRQDDSGHAMVYADMRTTLREFARIGELILNKGFWKGKSLISSDWLEESMKPRVEADFPGPPGGHYGYLWWLPRKDIFAAYGYLNNNLYLLPGKGLIFARCQRRPVLHATARHDEELVLNLLQDM